MNRATDGLTRRPSMAGRNAVALVCLAGGFPIAAALAAHLLFGGVRHVQEPVHELVELVGSCIAVGVTMLLWLRAKYEGWSAPVLCVAAALTGMGLVDAAHAVSPIGAVWSWLRHGATLWGGCLFALVWIPLPTSVVRRGRSCILLVSALSLSGCAAIWWQQHALPSPWGPGGYTRMVKSTNMLGGLGLLAAAVFFLRRYLCRPAAEELVFAGHTLVFGVSALLFGFSHVWAADWWAWHGFRLLAYTIILAAGYRVIVDLYTEAERHALDLDHRVEQQTAELRQLASIVESSDDAILTKSLDGVITTWNQGAARLYGYTSAEAIGRPITILVPPDRYGEVENLLSHIKRGEPVQHYETVRRRKDGQSVEVSVALSPVKDIHGEIIGASSIARDITERKRSAEALRESEGRLRLLSENVPDLVWTCQPDGRCDYLNSRWIEYTGVPAAGQLGYGWLDRLHPDDREPTMQAWQRTVKGDAPFHVEFRIQGRDGSYRWFATRAIALRDEEGKVVRWFGTNQDIEELRRMQTALVENQRRLELAQKAGGIGTWEWLISTGEVIWTRELEALYGLPAGGFGGKYEDWRLAVHPADRERAEKELRSAVEARTDFHSEFRIVWPDQSIHWMAAHGSHVFDAVGLPQRMVGINVDITKRKGTEEEIRQLNAGLERAVAERTADLVAANRELESFNYSVSHDLRAPLRHIDGFSKILLEEFSAGIPEDGRRCINRISEGARRMGRMIDELLELSRTSRREVRKQLTGLAPLVTEVLEGLAPETQDREIEWRIGELPLAHCDPVLASQVFTNLLSNAIKFSRTRRPAIIEVGQKVWDGEAVFFVRDNGVGFSMKYAGKLFGVFQRLHRQEDFEGIGVGLVTVQRIIEKHGGRIWADAELDKGATFYFTLEPPVKPRVEEPRTELAPVLTGDK